MNNGFYVTFMRDAAFHVSLRGGIQLRITVVIIIEGR